MAAKDGTNRGGRRPGAGRPPGSSLGRRRQAEAAALARLGDELGITPADPRGELLQLTPLAIKVLKEGLCAGTLPQRLKAAVEVLDRAIGKPQISTPAAPSGGVHITYVDARVLALIEAGHKIPPEPQDGARSIDQPPRSLQVAG